MCVPNYLYLWLVTMEVTYFKVLPLPVHLQSHNSPDWFSKHIPGYIRSFLFGYQPCLTCLEFELQRDNLKALCSIFKETVTVHWYNQGVIALAVATQMRPHINHTVIKYHHFHSFTTNGDVKNMLTPRNILQILIQRHYTPSHSVIYATWLTVGRQKVTFFAR